MRCRRVIDREGNCKHTNIYLFINKGKKYQSVLESIITLMPKITVIEHNGSKRVAKSRDEDKLVEYLKKLKPGRYEVGLIQKSLHITPKTMERIVAKTKGQNELSQTLENAGIVYDAQSGKGGYKVFIIGKSGGD